MAVVAPIYVAAGFALYLNRRVELEAWDIELGFRRLAQRVAGVVLFALGLGLVVPGPEARAEAYADDTNWEGPEPAMVVLSPRRQSSRDAIYDVLAGPDFNQEQVLRYPKFLADLFETDEEPPPQADVEWLVSMIRSVALVAEVLLWAGVIALLLWIVYRARLLDVVGRLQRNRPRERPREIMGLAVDAESLPDDVTAEGMRLWQAGAQREALSLIYRAALTALIDRFNCELNAADTEGECLDKARAVLPESALGYLQVLTRTWQFAAYGHSLPQDSRFAELCGSWPVVFEAEPDDAP
jgi:hypothetical protein